MGLVSWHSARYGRSREESDTVIRSWNGYGFVQLDPKKFDRVKFDHIRPQARHVAPPCRLDHIAWTTKRSVSRCLAYWFSTQLTFVKNSPCWKYKHILGRHPRTGIRWSPRTWPQQRQCVIQKTQRRHWRHDPHQPLQTELDHRQLHHRSPQPGRRPNATAHGTVHYQ